MISARFLKRSEAAKRRSRKKSVKYRIVSEPHFLQSEQATILVTLGGTAGMFSTLPMLVFASWHYRSLNAKFNNGRLRYTTFCWNTVFIRLTALGVYQIFGPWEWALIRGWALIKFSSFSASVVRLFYNKTINGNNKTRRCNKARFL